MDRFIEHLLCQGVEQGVFPGAAASVSWGREGERKQAVACCGIKDSRYPEDRVTEETFFDLASLTKALSTTLIIYALIQERKLNPDDRLERFFPDSLPGDKKNIRLDQLLSHSSGLAAYKTYFLQYPPEIHKKNRENIIRSILAEPLEYEPGSRCVYSDLGFIILGKIIEQVTGESLARGFNRYVAAPAGLSGSLFFLPLPAEEVRKNDFTATENCPWRGRILRAEVHDEHCRLMGGVSGHAGLFGTAEGVARLCGLLLDQWQGVGQNFAWSGMLQQGLVRQYPDQTWCLGFDTPSSRGSSAGKLISPSSVGHLGYAGTSFWIDPERDLVMVLLTNRVHPSRENKKIRSFRPYWHTRIIEYLNSME